MIRQLAKDLVPQFFVHYPFIHYVIAQCLLPFPAQVVLVHEAEDHLEDHQRVRVILVTSLREERRLYGLPFHAEDVAFEVNVGEFGELVLVDVVRQRVIVVHRYHLTDNF